jgi:hypothetical protein
MLWCSESSHPSEATDGSLSAVGRQDILSWLYDCSPQYNGSKICEGIASRLEGSCTHHNIRDIIGQLLLSFGKGPSQYSHHHHLNHRVSPPRYGVYMPSDNNWGSNNSSWQ